MAKQCMHCYISGKVQGVCFRATTKAEAQKLGLVGWVRNLPDGRVEVLACGEKKALELLHMWLKKGPELAKVSECTHDHSQWQEYENFTVV